MQIIADLHLHSRFSRAVSPQMTIEGIASWAQKKGIGLVATGDWTHPIWMREIGEKLEEDGNGLLRLKDSKTIRPEEMPSAVSLQPSAKNPLFLLSTEISCIYSQGGKTRRVHTLVWVPTITSAQKINRELTKRGCNLMSDGRPIIGLSLIHLSELVLTVEPRALIVPAHIWTPWFSVYGKMGGFESLEEAFGEYANNIYAVETGLSSSPDMNWRIKELDTRSIVSFSDAHSGPKLGREVTVFEWEPSNKSLQTSAFSYQILSDAISNPSLKTDSSGLKAHIAYTIEFYPEEGKYHYTGHRDCNVRLTPEETITKGGVCPACGKPLTQGVMQRVEELAKRQIDNKTVKKEGKTGLLLISDNERKRPPFVMLVPLQEIIAEAIGSPVTSSKTQMQYDALTTRFGGEFPVLLGTGFKDITAASTVEISDGIRKVRMGDIVIDPGYDGVFGVVKIWKSDKEKSLVDKSKEQLGLF